MTPPPDSDPTQADDVPTTPLSSKQLAPKPPVEPLDKSFVASAMRNPLRAMDLTLAEPERVGLANDRSAASAIQPCTE